MKINANPNGKINGVILTFALVAILVNFILSFFQGSYTDNWWLGAGGILAIVYLLFRGPSEFKYDSEGEVLNFTSKDLIWGKLIKSFNKHYEFPKRRLHDFKLGGGFLRKRLFIYIKSRSGTIKERSILISYLSRNQKKTLINSLKKYSHKGKHGRRKSGSRGKQSGAETGA
ncbi:MAG: hypothetical protein ACPGVV_08440 [Croceimicrobium sp.]|nr:hypothetical protein [Bacteroidota bacterium]